MVRLAFVNVVEAPELRPLCKGRPRNARKAWTESTMYIAQNEEAQEENEKVVFKEHSGRYYG
jgi:hypothetical protein